MLDKFDNQMTWINPFKKVTEIDTNNKKILIALHVL